MNQRHQPRVLVIVTLIALLLIGTHFTGGSAAAAGGISINDVSLTEGNSGTANATFTYGPGGTFRVWDAAQDTDPNAVEVYVGYLRRKVGRDLVRTVRGAGYRLGP